MEETTYLISFKRGRKRELFQVTCEDGDEAVRSFTLGIFSGRTRRPEKLKAKDAVKVALFCVTGEPKVLTRFRVYNRSVRQAASELVRSVKKHLARQIELT